MKDKLNLVCVKVMSVGHFHRYVEDYPGCNRIEPYKYTPAKTMSVGRYPGY